MPAILTDLEIDEGGFVDKGANQRAKIVLVKRDDEPTEKRGDSMDENVVQRIVTAVLKAFHSEPAPEAGSVVKEEPPEKEVETLDTVSKADFEALQKQLADQKAEIEKIAAERDAREAELKKAHEERALSEQVELCKADIANIGKADELGAFLKRVRDELGDDDHAYITGLLKAASEQVGQSDLFKETGSGATDDDAAPADRLEKLAKAYAKEHDVDYYTAYAEVMKANKELYDEYLSKAR